MRLVIYLAIALALSVGSNLLQWRGYAVATAKAQGEYATAIEKANADAQIAARQKEAELSVASAKVAEEYERGKKDAQAIADRVVADLRSGQRRLRDRWTCPSVGSLPRVAATPPQPDAAAIDRAESAGRIVGAAAACDQQVIGLQALIRADRGLQ